MGAIYDIRFEIYRRKFFVKFLNNFINQLTPFFFYAIGGYLVIRGNLSFGALVAVLAAYKDMSSPWKELLDFYQQKEDSRIKYEQIVEQFQPAGMARRRLLLEEPESIPHLHGELFGQQSVAGRGRPQPRRRRRQLQRCRSTSTPRSSGRAAAARTSSALLLARLVRPTGGRITIGGHNLEELPLAVVGRRIGYSGATPYLFAGSLRDNLLLGLRHRPLRPADYDDEEAKRRGAPARGGAPLRQHRFRPACRLGRLRRGRGRATPRNCRRASPRSWCGSISRRTSTISACAGGSIRRRSRS